MATHFRTQVSSVSCATMKAARSSRCMYCFSPRPSIDALTPPRAGRDEHGVLSVHGVIDRCPIARIALDHVEPIGALGDRGRIAREHCGLMTSSQQLPDGMPAGLPRRADDEHVHDILSFSVLHRTIAESDLACVIRFARL